MAENYFPTVVIGGGVTGLSAAYHTGEESLVLERNSRVGGTSRSEEREGVLFDYVGHTIWAQDPYARGMLAGLLQDNLYFQSYQVATHTGERHLPPLRKSRRPNPVPSLPDRVAAEYTRSLGEGEGRAAR